METYIIGFVDFKTWFWEKFEEWRKGTTKGPTAFARYLGVKQQLVSGWLNGEYKPRMDSIRLIAEKYPDVYDVLGVEPVQADTLDGLPSDVASAVRSLLDEIREAIERAGVDPESPEAVKISNDILDRFVSRRSTKV